MHPNRPWNGPSDPFSHDSACTPHLLTLNPCGVPLSALNRARNCYTHFTSPALYPICTQLTRAMFGTQETTSTSIPTTPNRCSDPVRDHCRPDPVLFIDWRHSTDQCRPLANVHPVPFLYYRAGRRTAVQVPTISRRRRRPAHTDRGACPPKRGRRRAPRRRRVAAARLRAPRPCQRGSWRS